jgi:adenine-specific DNA-methyltransferase
MSAPSVFLSGDDRKRTGSHYTPGHLARFVSCHIAHNCGTKDFVRVLDPALGDGELLYALLQELSARGIKVGEVVGFETNRSALEFAKNRLSAEFPDINLCFREADFLKVTLDEYNFAGTLFSHESADKFDLIIANPPYVRTQVLGSEQVQALARGFGLTGRVDLYHAFIEAMGRVLAPGGVAGIIVSNRFMTTKGGAGVREGILRQFDVIHVVDLGDTKLFEAAVLPAVLVLKAKSESPIPTATKFTSIYTSAAGREGYTAADPIDALRFDGVVRLSSGEEYSVRHGRLDHGNDPAEVWRIATSDSDEWLKTVAVHTHCAFGDLGKIRVGVKTTADSVFIRSEWGSLPERQTPEPEMLKSLTTHHIGRRFKPEQPQKQILYPHEVVDGYRKAVDLTMFPRSAAYLQLHRAALEKRTYVTQAGRKWYEIWVPQDPAAWSRPKLVFRDICETPMFWMDTQGTIINGDCYWLQCEDPRESDVLWLALAVGNSTFIESFYDHRFHNKLYSGRRRFMTQYVEAFPMPDPGTSTAKEIVQLTKKLYDLVPSPKAAQLESKLNALVWSTFGFTP